MIVYSFSRALENLPPCGWNVYKCVRYQLIEDHKSEIRNVILKINIEPKGCAKFDHAPALVFKMTINERINEQEHEADDAAERQMTSCLRHSVIFINRTMRTPAGIVRTHSSCFCSAVARTGGRSSAAPGRMAKRPLSRGKTTMSSRQGQRPKAAQAATVALIQFLQSTCLLSCWITLLL